MTYSLGTVTVTNGSATVTGNGTAWPNAVFPGDVFCRDPDSPVLYTIIAVDTVTQTLTLDRNYAGATEAGVTYAIFQFSTARQSPMAVGTEVRELLSRYSDVLTVAGNDRALTLNKTAAANNAITVLQTGSAERFRHGLIENDNWRLQRSADGVAYSDALTVNRASGQLTVHAGGASINGHLYANDEFYVGQTSGLRFFATSESNYIQSWSGATGDLFIRNGVTGRYGYLQATDSSGALRSNARWGGPAADFYAYQNNIRRFYTTSVGVSVDGSVTTTGDCIFGDGVGGQNIYLRGAAGASRGLFIYTGTVGANRWYIRASSTAESGGNTGSDFTIARYTDSGAFIGDALTLFRSNGYLYVGGVYSRTTANAANVHVDSGGGIMRSTSSIEAKEFIENVNPALARQAVLGARPVWYRSNLAADRTDWSYWGFVAEELAEVDPRLVHYKRFEHREAHRTITEAERIVERPDEYGEDKDGNEILIPQDPIVIPARSYEEPFMDIVELETPVPDGVAYERFTVLHNVLLTDHEDRLNDHETRLAALEAAA
jgi:hypothetical protein